MFTNLIAKLYSQDRGAGMVEYALLVALIALVVIIALELLGNGIGDLFNNITDELNDAGTP